MIQLNAASTTTSTSVFQGETKTTVTDTLFVSYVELGFASGSVCALIQKGTMMTTPAVPAHDVVITPAVPATDTDPEIPAVINTIPEVPAHTDFVQNMTPIRVDVSPDGTFRSNDGAWSGTIPNWAPTLASLRAPFDGLLLGVGLVQGTAI